MFPCSIQKGVGEITVFFNGVLIDPVIVNEISLLMSKAVFERLWVKLPVFNAVLIVLEIVSRNFF